MESSPTSTTKSTTVNREQCSTPFGINGIFTRSPARPPKRRGRCAQRLSASMESSLYRRSRPLRRSAVLNAFRHQRNLHVARTANAFTAASVLNAFRHQWNLHASGGACVSRHSSFVCSTPFGINGIFTRHMAGEVHALRRRAQRLSASKESSPVQLWNESSLAYCSAQRLSASKESSRSHSAASSSSPALLCSTPFGIKGIFTGAEPHSVLVIVHACSTPFGINGIFTALQVVADGTLTRSAQRLSASMESSRTPQQERELDDRACSTPFGIKGIFTRARATLLERSPRVCSTPFGINGIFTTSAAVLFSAHRRVLNAFRHQWNLHAQSVAACRADSIVCSTPFGINGIFTASTWVDGVRRMCSAQRLSASMESSLRLPT